MLEFHEEADGGAVGSAAETVIELLVGADGEGGGLLVVEGATGLVILAGLAQRYAPVDQLDDIATRDEFINKFVRDSASHGHQRAEGGRLVPG